MRFALLSLAAALLRGSADRAVVEETRVQVLALLQSAVKPEAKAEAAKAAAPAKAEAPKAEAAKAEAPKAEAPKAEAPKAEAPKAVAAKAEAPKVAVKAEAPKAVAAMAEAPKAEAPKAVAAKAEAPKAEAPKAAPAAKVETAKAAPAAKAEPKAAAPKKVESKEHQQLVVDQLMKLASNLESNEKKIVEMDKEEREHAGKSNITASMKDKDKEMWQNFDKWNHRMNEKTKVGSLDVISKIKHAVHFIKKGAMSGDANAMAGLEDVIKSMGQMAR